MDRIAAFRSFIDRTPADPFPRYGLAMEYKTQGDLEAAWGAFSELLDQFSDYVPTYLMAGGTLISLGRRSQAVEVFRKGIEVATRCADNHARRELEDALGTVGQP